MKRSIMEKILELTKKYGLLVVIILLTLIFIRGCGSNGDREFEHEELAKKIDSLSIVISSLPTNSLTKPEIKTLFDDGMWKYLELEELADKNNITVTELKHMDNNKTHIK